MTEHENPHTNHFFVDAKKLTTEHATLTGSQIKEMAAIPPTYQLFLEEEGNKPDRAISDGEGVSLAHETKHFFAVPPATFGHK